MNLKEKAEEKIKQLNEAVNLLDDLEWRVSWALDFSKFGSINEILYPLSYQLAEAREEMEDLLENTEETYKEYKEDKARAEQEFDKESQLQYCVT